MANFRLHEPFLGFRVPTINPDHQSRGLQGPVCLSNWIP